MGDFKTYSNCDLHTVNWEFTKVSGDRNLAKKKKVGYLINQCSKMCTHIHELIQIAQTCNIMIINLSKSQLIAEPYNIPFIFESFD